MITLPTVIPLSVQDILTNNSTVTITDIGEGASALTCHTELATCCREQDNPSGGALGEWIGPDSNQISESSNTSGFYITRQQSSIILNHGGSSTVGGQYCCVMPRTGGEMTFCVDVQMTSKLIRAMHIYYFKCITTEVVINNSYYKALRQNSECLLFPSATHASGNPTVGHSVAIAMILGTSVIVIVTLVMFLIVRTRQLQEAR